MRKGAVLAIAIAMTMPAIVSARSDEIPTLDVQPVCRGIASQSGESLEAGLRENFEQCVQSERDVREQLKKAWPTFSAADKQHCVTLAKTGGESSNTELLTCLEMARDVRAFRSAAATPSEAATSRALSSPSPSTPTVRPRPAKSVSPPPSANELPKMEEDSMRKELEQAKADAQRAKDSESMAHRKLADTEADLKQAKDEATRATKEAQQARADAQAALQSKTQTESKLAESEAARVAAEGREQNCQSAAKSRSGFGARLRALFGHKPSNPENP